MDYVLQKGDKVIAITEDDDTLIVSGKTSFDITEDAIVNKNSEPIGPERTLILGWNNRGPILIREMDNYVASGSFIKVVSDFDFDEHQLTELKSILKNTKVEFIQGETTGREMLDSLDITTYDNVQVLCYDDRFELQEADALTLITLLHLRRISAEKDVDLKIVSEMLDIKNRDLASVTKVDDFIVSDKLISLMMSQVSENKHLMRVFEDLLRSEGSEIYLKPVGNYIKLNTPVNFYTLLESAKRKSEIAIGYKIASQSSDSSKAYGVVINPDKSKIVSFAEDDRLIVLAED
jgi:hypothetical protein